MEIKLNTPYYVKDLDLDKVGPGSIVKFKYDIYCIVLESGILQPNGNSRCWTFEDYFGLSFCEFQFVYLTETPFKAKLGPIDPENINKLPVGTLVKWRQNLTHYYKRQDDATWKDLEGGYVYCKDQPWGTYTVIDLPEEK